MKENKSHTLNLIGLIAGLVICLLGTWQAVLLALAPGAPVSSTVIGASLAIFGFMLFMDTLYNWEKRPHWQQLGGVQIGLVLAVAGNVLFDYPASQVIYKNAFNWIFWFPIKLQSGFPFIAWQWNGTSMLWPDAYVLMMLIQWLGFILASVSTWFWTEE